MKRMFALWLLAMLALAASPVLAAETYEIDGTHSTVVFKVKHLGFTEFYGRFNDVSGTFTIDEEDVANSEVTLDIKADSVDTNSENRDKHLRSPDFFSAAQFPTIRFKSKKVERDGEAYAVTGDLTLRGVTKELTLTLERGRSGNDPWGKYRTGFAGSFTIDRTEFGVSYMPEGLGTDVTLMFGIEGIRK